MGKESGMRRASLVSMVMVVGAVTITNVRNAGAEEKPDTRRTISVNGQGEVTVSPDLAVLAVAVETTSPKAADAVTENATRSAKVAGVLKGLIGKDDKLTTTRYALE